MASVKVRTDTRDATRSLQNATIGLPNELRTTTRFVAQGAVYIFRAHAPKRSGRLRKGIRAQQTGGAWVVRADARNPETGYDYVGVTRKGHRVRVIRPTQGKVLRFVIGGRVLYRTHVKGYRPATDWAERAHAPVRRLARSGVVRLSQRIERLLR